MATMQHRRQLSLATLQKFYAIVVAALLVGVATPATAQEGCRQRIEPADPIPEEPWAQQWFDPERIWRVSEGEGVRVAVLDTGVDTGHPQLSGDRVLDGIDLLPEPLGAQVDCDSHGTAVASIIGASRVSGIGFMGLAPEAELLPVRLAERGGENAGQQQVDADDLAAGIRWAVGHGAQVVNVSIVFTSDHEVIANAVEYAIARGVVVVAAVGNPSTAGEVFTPYPASYPGVVGVGAVGYDNAGRLITNSLAGRAVDLVAPGTSVTAAAAGGGHRWWNGSSFATPFVSATVALLLATGLTGDQALDRLFATADAGPGGRFASGHGIVNPYRALTERTVHSEPLAASPPPDVVGDPAAVARAARWRTATRLAAAVAVSAVALGVLIAGGRAAWWRGRLRRWRPGSQPADVDRASPVDAPERVFFTVPTARRNR